MYKFVVRLSLSMSNFSLNDGSMFSLSAEVLETWFCEPPFVLEDFGCAKASRVKEVWR